MAEDNVKTEVKETVEITEDKGTFAKMKEALTPKPKEEEVKEEEVAPAPKAPKKKREAKKAAPAPVVEAPKKDNRAKFLARYR